MKKNRRKVLVGAGAAMFGAVSIGAGQSVLADEHDEAIEGDISLDTTVEYTEWYQDYLEDEENDVPVDCPDCADPHDIGEVEIETAAEDRVTGNVTITQGCSFGSNRVAVTLRGLSGSVSPALRCYEVATVEFVIEPAEPLEQGEYELVITVEGSGEEGEGADGDVRVWREERVSFEITGDPVPGQKGLDNADDKAGGPKERDETPGNHGRENAREKQRQKQSANE